MSDQYIVRTSPSGKPQTILVPTLRAPSTGEIGGAGGVAVAATTSSYPISSGTFVSLGTGYLTGAAGPPPTLTNASSSAIQTRFDASISLSCATAAQTVRIWLNVNGSDYEFQDITLATANQVYNVGLTRAKLELPPSYPVEVRFQNMTAGNNLVISQMHVAINELGYIVE